MAEKWQTVQYTLAIQRLGIVQVATLHAVPYTQGFGWQIGMVWAPQVER